MAAYTIPDVLGGEVILGKAFNRSGELAELVREGLPVRSLFLLAQRLDLRQAEISEKIGIPQRTLTRRMTQDSRLTPAESDRTVRLAQVYATATETLGDGDKSLFHTGGTALMIHQMADDYKTDPTGNAGARIACGVIQK